MTFYPNIDDVLGAHERLITEFGGSMGVRDWGALESAVARPQTGYYVDVIQEAAALWESLSQNIRLSMATSAPPSQSRLPS